MDDTRVPGMSIAVIRDAKLLWRRGFGAYQDSQLVGFVNVAWDELRQWHKVTLTPGGWQREP